MAPNFDKVKELRNKTNVSLNQCKKALEACDWDVTKAESWLGQQAVKSASQKSERKASEGVIHSYVHQNKIGVLVQVNCETDFASRSKEFLEFADLLAMQVATMSPEDFVDENSLLSQKSIHFPDKTVEELRTELVSKLGENVIVLRYIKWDLN
jgi:elongation factor Ts